MMSNNHRSFGTCTTCLNISPYFNGIYLLSEEIANNMQFGNHNILIYPVSCTLNIYVSVTTWYGLWYSSIWCDRMLDYRSQVTVLPDTKLYG